MFLILSLDDRVKWNVMERDIVIIDVLASVIVVELLHSHVVWASSNSSYFLVYCVFKGRLMVMHGWRLEIRVILNGRINLVVLTLLNVRRTLHLFKTWIRLRNLRWGPLSLVARLGVHEVVLSMLLLSQDRFFLSHHVACRFNIRAS
jgi:hypothetical protein